MAKSGVYTPLSIEAAVERSYVINEIFKKHGIKVLRIGLHASENLSGNSEVFAGAYHPAMGELVMSRFFYYTALEKLCEYENDTKSDYADEVMVIECSKSDLSKVIGQNKENKIRLREKALKTGFSDLIIKAKDEIPKGCLNLLKLGNRRKTNCT